MIGRNDTCWCGSDKKWKKCHYPQKPPLEQGNKLARQYHRQYGIMLKTPEQIAGIRAACELASDILDKTSAKAQPGVTTKELNDYAHELHELAGAIPASLNYGHPPFPGSICTSLNEIICHGIPDDQPLVKGDILNIDVACILGGYYGDNSRMVVIGGETTPERQLVTDVAYDCLMESIKILKPGVMVSEIGDVIVDVARTKNCSVVHQFVGHGVGVGFHEAPQVPHSRNSTHIPLAPGMTFTIEPMINAGAADAVIDPENQWVARTIDGKASAQWEHTLLITEGGHEILTPWKR